MTITYDANGCLDPYNLFGLLHNDLAEEDRGEVIAHLTGCTPCCRELVAIRRRAESLPADYFARMREKADAVIARLEIEIALEQSAQTE